MKYTVAHRGLIGSLLVVVLLVPVMLLSTRTWSTVRGAVEAQPSQLAVGQNNVFSPLLLKGATGQPSLFRFVKTVKVTPSGSYQNADFVRIGYVPGSDRFIVTFNTM